MKINADFSRPALVIPSAEAWVHSPESGVDRLMLDRIGDEVARATSLVRYAPQSAFPEHRHALGEEFLVLDGVFSDEHGDYPVGTYVRNPPETRHSPFSKPGCRIFVKLRQFDPGDLTPVVVDTASSDDWTGGNPSRLPLHTYQRERVEMLRLAGGSTFELEAPAGGAELLLVSGSLVAGESVLPVETWLRLPADHSRSLLALADSTLWFKSGHLPD